MVAFRYSFSNAAAPEYDFDLKTTEVNNSTPKHISLRNCVQATITTNKIRQKKRQTKGQ